MPKKKKLQLEDTLLKVVKILRSCDRPDLCSILRAAAIILSASDFEHRR